MSRVIHVILDLLSFLSLWEKHPKMLLSGALVGDRLESILIHKTVYRLWYFKMIINLLFIAGNHTLACCTAPWGPLYVPSKGFTLYKSTLTY